MKRPESAFEPEQAFDPRKCMFYNVRKQTRVILRVKIQVPVDSPVNPGLVYAELIDADDTRITRASADLSACAEWIRAERFVLVGVEMEGRY